MTPTFSNYLIGPLIERFGKRYPGISLNIHETTQDKMGPALMEDIFDLGIAFSEVRSPEIDCRPLFVEKLSVMVGSSHPSKRGVTMTKTELEAESFALLTPTLRQDSSSTCFFRHTVSLRTFPSKRTLSVQWWRSSAVAG